MLQANEITTEKQSETITNIQQNADSKGYSHRRHRTRWTEDSTRQSTPDRLLLSRHTKKYQIFVRFEKKYKSLLEALAKFKQLTETHPTNSSTLPRPAISVSFIP